VTPRCAFPRLLAGALALAVALAPASRAAPSAELWERWTAHDPGSEATVDHSAWDDFLGRHLAERDGINLVRYSRVPQEDRAALAGYVEALAGTAVSSLARDEQMAYWVNLYNALTIGIILDNLPVDSIRDISDGLFSSGPWDRKVVSVEGEELTLNDIEHRILRPIWMDPRVHYAVNCASIGCPNLAPRAYTGANLEEMLERGAKDYVNHPRGVSVSGGVLEVSSIYSWFSEDFGSGDAELIEHLRRYAEPGLRAELEGIGRVGGHDYDWSLNAAQ